MEKNGGLSGRRATGFAYANEAATGDDGAPAPCPADGCAAASRTPYDRYDHLDTTKGNTYWGTVLNIVVICGGPCMLTVPITFARAGYVPGVASALLLVAFYAYVMRMVSWCEHELCVRDRVPKYSYAKTVFVAFRRGPAAARPLAHAARCASYVAFVVVWFGYCCYAYVTMAQNARVLLRASGVELTFYGALEALFVPLLLLSWVPRLKYLVPVATAGNVCNFTSLMIVVYYVAFDAAPWRWIDAFTDASKVPLAMGSVLFTINGTGLMLACKQQMKEPRRFDSAAGVLVTSFGFLSFVYAALPLVCALKYGDLTLSSVIQNLPQDEWPARVAVACSSVALMAQYPFCVYIPFEILRNDVLKLSVRKSTSAIFVFDYVVRTGLVVASFAVSYVVTNVLVFVSIGGTVGTSIDSLVLPAVTHSLVMWSTQKRGRGYRWHLFKNALIVVLALVLVVAGVDDCIEEFVASGGSQSHN